MRTLRVILLTAMICALARGAAPSEDHTSDSPSAARAFLTSPAPVVPQYLFHFPPLQAELEIPRSVMGSPTHLDFMPQAPQSEPVQEPVHPSFHDFPSVLAYNFTRGLFSRANLMPLAVGGGLTALAAPADHDVADALEGSAPGWGNTGRIMGSGLVVFSSAGVVVAISPFVKSERFKSFSFTMAQSLVLNNVLTFSLKAAVNRTRPDGDGNDSFPSGHASNAFAWATVLAGSYGRRFAVPAYVVATFIALSRVELGRHFLSDVIAGATVGYVSGITALRGTKEFANKKKWQVMPAIGPEQVAIVFHASF